MPDSGRVNVVNKLFSTMARAAGLVTLALCTTSPLAGQNQTANERLVLSGDLVYFYGPGKPGNCTMSNQYKRGEPVGFRMTAINPTTGKRDRATQVVVHLSYAGKTVDLSLIHI